MANKRRRVRSEGRGDETASGEKTAERLLENLRRMFEKFRREHRRRARIPQSLREAALQALESGVAELSVRRACRISREQLDWWRHSQNEGEQQLERPEQKARIFPVVDDGSEICDEDAEQRAVSSLHLRVGRWEISIRQVEL